MRAILSDAHSLRSAEPSWLFYWGTWPDIVVSALGVAVIAFVVIMFWKSE
jgi:hypothetical protein